MQCLPGVMCSKTEDSGCCKWDIRKSKRSCLKVGPPCMKMKPKTSPSSSASPSVSTSSSPSPSKSAVGTVGTWNIVNRMAGRPVARHEACFTWVAGRGYLIGGRKTRSVSIFDPDMRTWTEGKMAPQELHHMQCVAYDNKVWVVSSWRGKFPREINNENIYIYDPMMDEWEERDGLPEPRRRGGGAAVLYDEKIYVVGGNRGGHGPQSTALGYMDYYDPEGDKWVTNLPDLPSPRDHFGGGIVGGRLCIAAGRDSGQADFFSKVILSTWCFDFEQNTWFDTMAPIEIGRAGAATGTICDGRLMVAGGESDQPTAWDRVDLFDGMKWTQTGDLGRGRHGTGLGVTDCETCGKVFIASGSGNRGGSPELKSTEVYLPNGMPINCESF